MKHLLLTASLLGIFVSATAQNEGSVFNATGRGGTVNALARDYQSIGINPANLGLKQDYKVAFSLGEFSLGMGSQVLTQSQLNKFVTAIDDNLTPQDRQGFIDAFANDNALNVNLDATIVGFSLQTPKIGGFAVSFRQRLMTHIGLNRTFSEILFLGRNAPVFQRAEFRDRIVGNEPAVSDVFDGSAMQIAAFNEFNLAYGIQLLESDALKLSVGAGYRYVQGLGVLDIRAAGGQFTGYNAMSAVFNVNYGDLVNDPAFGYDPQRGNYPFFKPAGTGHGFDIGVSAEIAGKVKVGLSLTDLGNMRWRTNVLQADDQPLQIVESDGIQTFNIFSEAATIVGDGLIRYQAGGERTTPLPTRLRAGAGFSPTDKFDLGLDITVPLNETAGNLPGAFVGAGASYKLANFLRLNTGVTSGGGYGLNVPLGLTLDFKRYEFGTSNGTSSALPPAASTASSPKVIRTRPSPSGCCGLSWGVWKRKNRQRFL
ncbi:MAG: DUF5723 family protein [Cytophagales bacterium]|nr:DUF5723 family protein [Cytophagales bacterium]